MFRIRLVYESSPTNFFASLFYAEYEPASRVLKYVNADPNPPIVVRPAKDGSCEMFYLQSEAMPVGPEVLSGVRRTVASSPLQAQSSKTSTSLPTKRSALDNSFDPFQ